MHLEIALLLVVTFALFRPDWFMDRLHAPYVDAPARDVFKVAGELGPRDRLVLVLRGQDIEGDDKTKTVAVQLDDVPGDGRKRLQAAGLTLVALGDSVQVANVRFGSRARKGGFEPGWDVAAVKLPTDRPAQHWVYLPALALLAVVWFSQRVRERRSAAASA